MQQSEDSTRPNRMAFSINQILSPMATDVASVDTPYPAQCQYDDQSTGQSKPPSACHSAPANERYLYPQLSNYWNNELYSGQSLYNNCRLPNPGFYHRSTYPAHHRTSNLYSNEYSGTGVKSNPPTSIGYHRNDINAREALFPNNYSCYDYSSQKQSELSSTDSTVYTGNRAPNMEAAAPENGICPSFNSCRFGSGHNDSGCHSDGVDDKRSSAGRSLADSDSSTNELHQRNEFGTNPAISTAPSVAASGEVCYGSCCSRYSGSAMLNNGPISHHERSGIGALTLPPTQMIPDPMSATSGSFVAAQHQAAAIAAINDPTNRLLNVSAHCNFHRPPLLSNTFPWMESRRERIAREY